MNQPSGTKQMTSSTSQACVMQSLQTNWSAHTALILEKGLACADPGIAQMLQMSKIEVSNSPGSDALESVWQVSKTGAGDYLSLYSIQDTVFLLSHRGAKYQVAKIMGRVTTASFAFLGSRVLVMVGNDGGLVTISMFDSNRGTVKPIAQSTVSSNLCDGPIAFTAYQPADFATRSDTNSLYVWVVRKRTAKRVTMAESSSESVIELLHINTITGTCKELYQFCADESFGNFARLEVIMIWN